MAIKKGNVKSEDGIKYEVQEKCGVVGQRGKYTLELRYVSWNGGEPKYDIRPWFTNENGEEKCVKGITLSGEELESLGKLINSL